MVDSACVRLGSLALLLAGGCGTPTTAGSPAPDASPASTNPGPKDAAGSDRAPSPTDTRARLDGSAAPPDLAPPDLAPPEDTSSPPADGGPADLAPVVPGSGPMPPAAWKEHWFEHDQEVKLLEYDEHAAIYVDDDVDRTTTKWLLPFMSRLWQYTKKTYGDGFGPDPRLYSIHHQGRYGGGHPSYYFDASHDNRNVSDCGPGPWREDAVDMPSHEVAHVVESANNGAQGSPAFGIWRDSKWAEIYQYDAYLALGMQPEAERLHRRFTNTIDDFPRAGTRWFRDWFYPLWRDHGGAQVMARFFRLLAQHFPKSGGGKRYARDLNWGEYIHFTSGAAGKDLKAMATAAFGWPAQWEAQFQKARADFPGVSY